MPSPVVAMQRWLRRSTKVGQYRTRMVARLGVLVVAALLVVTACSGGPAKANETNTADVYTAVLRQLLTPLATEEDQRVVYVAPFAEQKAFALETQVDVIANLAKEADVRFVDELSEAVVADDPGEPAKGTEVVLLGPVTATGTTGTTVEVEAQRYESETEQVKYRFLVRSSDGTWTAERVETVAVPPTTTP
jgi:hypothetical protein